MNHYGSWLNSMRTMKCTNWFYYPYTWSWMILQKQKEWTELLHYIYRRVTKFFPNLVWSDKFKCCDFYDSLCDAFFATFLACLAIYFITQDFLVTLLLEGYLQMSSLQNCKALAWITGGNHCIYGFNSISPVMINVEIVSIYQSTKITFKRKEPTCPCHHHSTVVEIDATVFSPLSLTDHCSAKFSICWASSLVSLWKC